MKYWRFIYPHLGETSVKPSFKDGLINKEVQSFRYRGNIKYITPLGGLFFLNPGEAHTGEAANNSSGFEYYAQYSQQYLGVTPGQYAKGLQ